MTEQGFAITTTIAINDTAVDQVTEAFGPNAARDLVLHQIIETQTEHVRRALISLGWTPPQTEPLIITETV